MAISFVFDGDDVVWTQRCERPALYLDTFAIREIADSSELSDRFTQGLRQRGGTWLLGGLSMGEFARFADPRHAQSAERLLIGVLPHIYLFWPEWEGARVTRGETDPSKRPMPPADRRNMDYFSKRWADTQSLPKAFEGMFTLVHERRQEMRETLDEVAAKLVLSLTNHRQLDSYRTKAKSARPDDGRTRQTIISGELLRELVLDTKATITPNEALDLMHTVDAVDYCDLVVLDGAWERRVNRLQETIDKAGISMPIARCFSKRNSGIERFIDAISSWPETTTSS